VTVTAGGSAARLPWNGQPYSVKRHGVTITNCDSEPVHTPGCVQDHGALLVVRPADLVILQASESTEVLLGRRPEALLGRPMEVVVGPDVQARVRAFLASEPLDRNPLYVLTLPPSGAGLRLDVTAHTLGGVAVLELEATGRSEVGAPDYHALVRRSTARLQAAHALRELAHAICEEVRAITGLDRVMVYRFHPDAHGEVFAESKQPGLPPWLGLHYPADDIPKPVRDIFKKIWVRPLPDVSGGLAELVPLVNPDTGAPLDLTHCFLRGPSIMYTEYLRNMGVTASLTMPIRRGEELWGLIAGHHYAGRKPVPYQVRAACEFVAQVASLQLQLAEAREQLTRRARIEAVHDRLVARAAQEGGLSAMIEAEPELLEGFSATGAALYHRHMWWTVGATPTHGQLDALADWLGETPEWHSPDRPIYVTDALPREHPAAAAFAELASGALAFPLSRARRCLMVWFRPETIQTVSWGGNPHDKPRVPGPHGPRLTPRVSFELFRESVRERSLPWHPVEVEAAARLRLLVMELVVNRAERLAELNADLARSNEDLDAFAYVASHDLKEPLRGIYKYAHQLQDGAAALDEEQRRKLHGLMRLALRMDGLLDSLLHFSRVGQVALQLEDTDLDEVLSEALEMVEARRNGGQAEVVVPRPLPHARCDRVGCREILVNLLSNALKYTNAPHTRIEVGYVGPGEERPPTWPPGAAGHVVYYVRDNGIGIAPKHHGQVFKMFKRLHGRDEYGGGAGAGLAIVKKLVERHRGQIWLESALGEGTCFYFTLPGEHEVRA
jgi:two-component system, chemotaxis family, sensor kinase Cph1